MAIVVRNDVGQPSIGPKGEAAQSRCAICSATALSECLRKAGTALSDGFELFGMVERVMPRAAAPVDQRHSRSERSRGSLDRRVELVVAVYVRPAAAER